MRFLIWAETLVQNDATASGRRPMDERNCVMYNNDYYNAYPMYRILEIGDHRIYMCHGHRDMFFGNYQMLAERAKSRQCDMAVCGHSHIYHHEVIDGVTCLNPGSIWRNRDLSEPSYMEVELEKDQIRVKRKSFLHRLK